MDSRDRIIKDVVSALEQERRIDLHRHPIEVDFRGKKLVLAGEVESVAAKKLALEYAAAFVGGGALEDRLLVRPGEAIEDGALGDLVYAALSGESAFNDFDLYVRVQGADKEFRSSPRNATGRMEVEVSRGVVTLSGTVESYTHKALAGVLVWWRRGTRDVVNNLSVTHPLDDPDGEMTDALRMVLEKDRFVQEAQVRVHCRDFTAVLDGAVRSDLEKELAEADAWYLLGVTDVENRLKVLG
ncbi:BON domain-containing protein [Geomonas sp. RF6]|uniref:BON domain-containing protein n=1 Tax=Geomonas sp. RF6 TaxID=2897342 RepID=UPI001E5F2B16|nr:BON domain-containing protein [Geomonas sp. RF6]UFS71930.1 BON domain-containing protein [Geomonas sp. RF6]